MPSIGHELSKKESYYDASDHIKASSGGGFRQGGKVGGLESVKADKKKGRKGQHSQFTSKDIDHELETGEVLVGGEDVVHVENPLEQRSLGEDGLRDILLYKKKSLQSKNPKPPKVYRRHVGVQVNMGGIAGTSASREHCMRSDGVVRFEGINGEVSKPSLADSVIRMASLSEGPYAEITSRDIESSSATTSTSSSSALLGDSASSRFLAAAEVATGSGTGYAEDGVPDYSIPVSVLEGRADDELDALNPASFPKLERQLSKDSSDSNLTTTHSPTIGARNRWRRLRHTVVFANHMAHIRSPANDLLENRVDDLQYPSADEDAGGAGAAAFEGAETAAVRWRPRGRKGMDSMIVKQEKGYLSFIQDFYVACLKMPIGHFLVGVFLAPVALGLFFTPFYLVDMAGLNFEGDPTRKPNETQAQSDYAKFISVFLYSLSLSTTFGGSPVTAVAPFCLLVANVNTLLAQFLFVFLSGAVFARMSQPSHPVRCSKKAVIRESDFVPSSDETKERFRVLAVRLVLTGPPPCELVDAKICLIFRIFIKLPTGSMFCSTQNLNLLRSEVSYLRYGIMVRHVIDRDSPIYGHTMGTLQEGDASFSLTIMALERTSMQPIFHLEDYFVHDGDIIWDGDYEDFISLNAKGHRVLDHSKIDTLRPFKVAGIVSQAVSRLEGNVARRKEMEQSSVSENSPELRSGDKQSAEEVGTDSAEHPDEPPGLDTPSENRVVNGWVTGLRNRKLWETKSSSFTRATSDHGLTRTRND